MTTAAILVVGAVACVILKRIDNALQDIRGIMQRKVDIQTTISADSK